MGNSVKTSKTHKFHREDSIVVTNEINSINECYNMLKDNLLFIGDDKNSKVLQIESSFSGEGKTTLVCNLAVSLSFNDKKVLVIDLDFRKPKVHKLFQLSNQDGLVDYVADKITFDKLIKKTQYENVDIISRGSELFNPSLLLTSDKFAKLINQLRENYDYIFFDSPPILQVSDYIHISQHSDGVIFVVAYGRTKRKFVSEAASLLKERGIKVVGSVMTFVNKKDPYASYYGTYKEKYYNDKKNSDN